VYSEVRVYIRLSGMFSNVSTDISVAIFRVNVFVIGSPYAKLVVDADSDSCKKYSSDEAK
jgi:hypothetical protein